MASILPKSGITSEQLLAEVEDLIRTAPPKGTIRHETEENFSWLGRASALIGNWSIPKTIQMGTLLARLRGQHASDSIVEFAGIMTLLYEARADLRMSTLGPVSVAVGHGSYFDYFDEIRKIVEAAIQDLLFVDPYLDAEFVSRYLPHVHQGVAVRLSGERNLLLCYRLSTHL